MLKTLTEAVKQLTDTVNKQNRRLVEYDRRQTRMEVTVNKTFITLGDLANGVNLRMMLGSAVPNDLKLPKGFREPKLPIETIRQLMAINSDFKNNDYLHFCVSFTFTHENSIKFFTK